MKKQRVDSVAGAVKVAESAADILDPPIHLPKAAIRYWRAVVARRAKSDWSSEELVVAALLARTYLFYDLEQKKLMQEGAVLSTAAGNPCQNPRVAVVHGLNAQIKGLRNTLSIHGRAAGEQRDHAKRNSLALGIEGDVSIDDDLLAGTRLQ